MIQNYTVRGQTLRVHKAGDRGAVLLFVHGFPMNHSQWHRQIDYFVKTNRIIAPDLRGMGGSSITDPDAVVTMEQHADDLLALLDHFQIKEPVILIGLSMGGYVAWQMVKKYASRLKGLVLCHTRIIADTPAAATDRHNLAAKVIREQSSKPVEDVFLPKLLAPTAPPRIAEQVRQMARTATPAGLAADLRGLAAREDASRILPMIRIPTQVISGELDQISPPDEMQGWANQISGARFQTLPGVGHLSPLEAPDTFNQCLSEFLSWCTGTTNR